MKDDTLTVLATRAGDALLGLAVMPASTMLRDAASEALEAVAAGCFAAYGPASTSGSSAQANADVARRGADGDGAWLTAQGNAWKAWAVADDRTKVWPG